MKLMTVTVATAALALFAEAAPASASQHLRVAHHEGSSTNNAFHHVARHEGDRRTFAARRIARHYADREEVSDRASGHATAHLSRHADRSAAESAYALAPSGDQGASYGARPAAWCGWEMRHLVSQDPGPSYNLAANWAHWGRSGPAGVGAIVVWPHHVGKIVGRENGQWVIESGNDGHQTRSRARSIAGAIAFRWG